MSTKLNKFSESNPELTLDKQTITSQRYAIAVADWNKEITHSLLNGAVKGLKANGIKEENITIVHVPGTIELTYAASVLSSKTNQTANKITNKYAAIIVLGCVIKGETSHFDYVCSSVTQGITELNTRHQAPPIVFGVLTTNNLEQAKARAGGKYGNKGEESAITAIKMANIIW